MKLSLTITTRTPGGVEVERKFERDFEEPVFIDVVNSTAEPPNFVLEGFLPLISSAIVYMEQSRSAENLK